ncbi:FAD:protein FMN transferase [Neptuniibacter marinus]|uniref:FAD:protein FMN transferase n=1 Tax=Neptuniibacter marinus TaxID=1806670 RepID=UPI003B58F8E9
MILVANTSMFVIMRQAKKWPAALLLATSVFVCLLLSGCESEQPKIVSHQGMTMGTTFTVKWVSSQSPQSDTELNKLIDNTLVDINQSMSTYIPDSELSILNRTPAGEFLSVSEPLAHVLALSKKISVETEGAFDNTVGPLVNLWGFGPDGRVVKMPLQSELDSVRDRVGYDYVKIEGTQVVKQRQSYIDLSAIAKGYGVDVLAELLESHGIENYLVEIGGELRARGLKPDGNEWRIAIESPTNAAERTIQRIIAVKNVGIATSGDYRNYFEEEGVRFSHTIDPVTGKPINHKLVSVTVLMPTCAEADALATAMMVMGPDKAFQFAQTHKLNVFLIVKTDTGFEEKMTPGFNEFMVQ